MQTSTDATRLGINRTGVQMSPKHTERMLDGMDEFEPTGADGQPSAIEDMPLAATRLEYIEAADPLGSVPAPGTVKGAVVAAANTLTGRRPQVFIDKLAERLAFERGGARLYDAVLTKALAHEDELDGISVEQIREIRNHEAQHALLIKECIESLGADPTAQTPCADLVGVETMGLIQVATDPRTTLAQTLHAALAAELLDNEGWEDLMNMARESGHEDMAGKFKGALDQEVEHLTKVRNWYTALTMETSELL